MKLQTNHLALSAEDITDFIIDRFGDSEEATLTIHKGDLPFKITNNNFMTISSQMATYLSEYVDMYLNEYLFQSDYEHPTQQKMLRQSTTLGNLSKGVNREAIKGSRTSTTKKLTQSESKATTHKNHGDFDFLKQLVCANSINN